MRPWELQLLLLLCCSSLITNRYTKKVLMCCFPASVVIFRVYKIVASGSENNYWILTHYLFSMTCWPADLNPRYTVSFKSIEVLCPPWSSRGGSSSKFGSWHSAFTSKHMTQSVHSSSMQRGNQKILRMHTDSVSLDLFLGKMDVCLENLV